VLKSKVSQQLFIHLHILDVLFLKHVLVFGVKKLEKLKSRDKDKLTVGNNRNDNTMITTGTAGIQNIKPMINPKIPNFLKGIVKTLNAHFMTTIFDPSRISWRQLCAIVWSSSFNFLLTKPNKT
jgi:hypothetical protein